MISTNGSTIAEHCCMKSNSNKDADFGIQSIYINSPNGQLLESSVTFCQGTGPWAPSVQMNKNYEVNSINSSFNKCNDISSILTIGNGTIIFCNFVSNVATRSRIVHMTNTTLLLSNFVNNSIAEQGIIFVENFCYSYVEKCSLVINKGFCGFYSNYYQQEISSLYVSNCSLIDNEFTNEFWEVTPSIVKYDNSSSRKYENNIPDRLNCHEFKTLYIYLETIPVCQYYQLQFLLFFTPYIYI